MGDSIRQHWLGTAILIGTLYLAVGLTSAALAGAAASVRMVFVWRVSAFIVSGLAFAAHLGYEYFRLRHTTWPIARHTAAAVALGGFGLALAANLHDLGSAAGYRPRMLIALVAWPLLTAVPAFIVALIVVVGLGVKRAR